MSTLSAREVRVGWRVGDRLLEAVRGVSLSVARGERVGLVGESGCGKSSLLRAVLGLEPLLAGSVTWAGQPMHGAPPAVRARLQPVFQDVGAALDPRWTIRQTLEEPLTIHGRPRGAAVVEALLQQVQLPGDVLDRRPATLSVGQRQRVNLARALALEPELLLLDEPVSALDVSVQAQVVNLLLRLARERSLGLLVVSHDLDVVAHLTTRLLVMYAGRVVEAGPTAAVLEAPRHPYTRLLVAARRHLAVAAGEPPPSSASVAGCAFRARCAEAVARCELETPPLAGATHASACWPYPGS